MKKLTSFNERYSRPSVSPSGDDMADGYEECVRREVEDMTACSGYMGGVDRQEAAGNGTIESMVSHAATPFDHYNRLPD